MSLGVTFAILHAKLCQCSISRCHVSGCCIVRIKRKKSI